MLRIENEFVVDDSIINQLATEVILEIFSYLDVPTLGVVSSVCHFWNKLSADDYLWNQGRVKDFSSFAVERIKTIYKTKSAKESCSRLAALLIKTEQNLLNYYLDAWRIFGVKKDKPIPFDLTTQEKQKARFKLIKWLEKWEEKDIVEAKKNMQGQPVEVYSDHHCKLYAAAYVGNTKLLVELINKKEPILASIFNFNSWDLGNYGIKICENNLENFPQKYSFFTKNFRFGETSLVDLAYMHDQQVLLDLYYEIALKRINEDEKIFWAIICRQQLLLSKLISDDTSFNNLIGIFRERKIVRLYTILHFAIAFGNEIAVKLLLKHGMSLPDDEASLYGLAIYRDHVKVLEEIASLLADHEIIDVGVAARQGDNERVLHLLSKSSKSYLQDEALFMANYWNQYQTIKQVLEHYPHKIELFISEEEFFMPLLAKNKELIDLIVTKIMAAPRDILLSFVRMLKDKANSWNNTSDFFHYLLQQAMQHENIALLKMIMLAQLDISGKNEKGLTVLEFIKTCDANYQIKDQASKLIQCELTIRQALMPNNTSFFSVFFSDQSELDLCCAAKLDKEYFVLRMQAFMRANPNSSICKKIKNFEIIQDFVLLSSHSSANSYEGIVFDV